MNHVDAMKQALDVLQGCLKHPDADNAIAALREALTTAKPATCWKCGDTDPAFQAACDVPACGMREALATPENQLDDINVADMAAPQEPVAIIKRQLGGSLVAHIVGDAKEGDMLYTHPPAAQPTEPDFWTVCAWHEGGGECGWIPIPGYSNETEAGVKNLVLETARKEGYKGTVAGRLMHLGWEIRPVYLSSPPTAQRQPLTDTQNRAAFEEFVKSEMGDIAVMDAGRYISPKIQNYWRVWEAASSKQFGVTE